MANQPGDLAADPTPSGTYHPVTAAQRAVYFGHQLGADPALYNTGVYTDTVGPVDLDRLIAALEQVVRTAQTLQVNFAVNDGELVQIPRDPAEWSVPVMDLRAEPDPEAASRRWMDRRMARPVDLERDPLAEIVIHRLAEDRIRIYQQYHHIVTDGYGIGIVARAVARVYRGGAAPDPQRWSLAEYVGADQDYRAGAQFRADRAHWLAELADLPAVSTLLTDAGPVSRGPVLATVPVDADTRGRLADFAAEVGARSTTVLIALLTAFIARRSGSTDPVINLPTAARGDRRLRWSPSMVAGVLPLRVPVPAGTTPAALVAATEAKLEALRVHGRYRGEDIGAELTARDPQWRPPGVGINIIPATAPDLAGAHSTAHVLSSGPVGELEFVVVLRRAGHPLQIALRAHPDAADQCADIAAELRSFLTAVAADPHAPLRAGGADAATFGEIAAVHDENTTGPVPLPPLLADRRERTTGTRPQHRRTAALTVPGPAETDAQRRRCTAALTAVLTAHPGLRLRLDTPAPLLWLTRIDPAAPAEIAAAAARLVDPAEAEAPGTPLLIRTRPGTDTAQVCADADLVDAASFRIVLADLAAALAAPDRPLDPVPLALKTWAEAMTAAAADPARSAELAHWRTVAGPGGALAGPYADRAGTAVETDAADGGEEDAAPTPVRAELPAGAVDAAADTAADRLWLAALTAAIGYWRARTGRPAGPLTVQVYGDGRHALPDGSADPARTVGPLAWSHPVRLEPIGAAEDETDPAGWAAAASAAADRALAAAPNGGLGWPLLRHLNPQTAPVLAALPGAEVALHTAGPGRGDHLLEVAVDDAAGTAVFTAARRTGPGALTDADLRVIADGFTAAVGALVAAAVPDAGRSAGSARPHRITLDRDGRDALAAATPATITDVWALSPLQRGLYFQSVFDADAGTDVYTAQFHLDFGHRLDVDRLGRALDALAATTPTTRAGFVQLDGGEPVQIIAGELTVPLTEIDLTGLDPEAALRAAEQAEARDRGTPFDLAAPPLWRAMLLRLRPGPPTDPGAAPAAVDRLVINRQFLLWDGWSGGLFVDRLLELYAADTGPVADTHTSAFTDYLDWLAGRDTAAAEAAWRAIFADLDAPCLLAGTRRPGRAQIPDRVESHLSTALSAALRLRARTAGVTLNALLTAVMGLLLAAETGRTDVVFGSTTAGRPTEVPGLAEEIGMFLNTVPIRVRLRPDETPTALMRRVQDEYVDRIDHEFLGLGEIHRATGHEQLFDTLFVLQNFKDAAHMAVQSARYGLVGEDSLDHTHYPLAVVISPGERLHIKIDHRTEVIDHARARAVHDRLVDLLTVVADGYDRPVATLDARAAAGGSGRADEAAARGADPAAPLPDETIAEMLRRRARTSGSDVAVVCGDRRRTFAELDADIARLAQVLAARGAGPETLVALGLPRSIETVVALFAVLSTGAGYVPLELDQPDGRLRTVLADARPALTVTTAEVAARLDLPGDGTTVILTPGHPDVEAIAAADRDAPLPGPAGRFAAGYPYRLDHPAYVIYTSGSTGRPKGVVTPYRGLTNMHLNHQREIFGPVVADVHAADGPRRLRIAHTVSFAFDMSWEELLWLVEGHEVHICDEDLRRDSCALVDYCDAHRIDVVNVTPTYAAQLFDDGLLDETRTGGSAAHRPALILLGGEAVSPAVWSRLHTAVAGPGRYRTRGYNLYGPTEYTINALGAGTEASATPTVGAEILRTRAYVLDPWLRPVLDGVVGELYLAGIGLARGYLGRPGLSASRFVADPFVPGLMYRTGDMVRRRPDGMIDYLGRDDDQIKIRGHRIELAEIRAAIEAVPGVGTAAVVAVADPRIPGAHRLSAYLVPAAGDAPAPGGGSADPLAETVTAALRSDLPEPMVPGAVQTVAALPMTVNGKLDVAALPTARFARTGGGRGPRTDTERAVCAIFADLLGIDGPIGAEDDFFDLGGHSMIAMRVVSRVRAELGVALSIRELFDARTPAAVAAVIADAPRALPPVLPVDRPARVPLSAAQERLWLVQQLQDTSLPYHYAYVAHLTGAVDAGALRAALADVLDRHESLRTVIGEHPRDGAHQQVLATDEAVRMTVADPVPPGPGREDRVRTVVAAQLTADFDLRVDPPIRLLLVPGGDGAESVLALVLHHIATDEWSDRPLLRDLTAAYLARAAGHAPAAPPLPVQYADYTLWQRDLLTGAAAAADRDFWLRTLTGAPAELELPYDRPRPRGPVAAAGHTAAVLPAATTQELGRHAEQAGATMFMALHALTAVTLSRLGAGEDIVIGTPVSGRSDTALEDLVGFFVNTVVLRTNLSGAPDLPTLLGRVRAADLAALDHAELPFQQVVELLAPDRVEGRNPLFQVLVSHLQTPETAPELLGLPTRFAPLEPAAAKFDLTLTYLTDPATGATEIRAEYSAALFDAATVETMLTALLAVADAVTADPHAPVSGAPVLDRRAEADLIAAGRGAARPRPFVPLGRLLTAGADLAPEAPAVIDATAADPQTPQRVITHADWCDRVGALARALAARGIGPGDVVATALARSVEQIAVLHAIARCGAAYLPIDPELPAERIEFMLADAAPALVIVADADTAPAADGTAATTVATLIAEAGERTADPAAESALLGRVHPDHPACVLYTSGTTGRPKGVVVSQRALTHRLRWMHDRAPLAVGDTVPAKTPVTFDVSAWETLTPFVAGATLVVLPAEAHRDPAGLLTLMDRYAITVSHFVPSLLDAALAAHRPGAGRALRRIVCSGEALTARTVAAVARTWPHARLDNLYGPTEAAVEVSMAADLTAASLSGRDAPLGEPADDAGLHVLDDRLRPVPAGVHGELYLSGPQLALGYLHRPGLTAAHFVADPYGPPGTRLYRTGDRVRRTRDGALEYLGRADGQIKIRGLRLELGEIEAALAALPGVARAAAAVRTTPAGDPVVVGYVVPDQAPVPDGPADEGGYWNGPEPRRILAARLPEHALPARIVRLDDLPVSFNGKLDRTALPTPRFVPTGAPVLRGAAEQRVAAAFAEVLGVDLDAIGSDTDFFAAGGHSLAAVRVVNALAATGPAPTGLRAVFDAPTVAGLATALGADSLAAAAGDTDRRPVLSRGPRPDRIPLSFGQYRLWLLDRIGVPAGAYAVPIALTVPEEIDREALTGALADVVDRHPVLRTVYRARPGGGLGADDVAQVVLPAGQAAPTLTRIVLETDTGTDDPMAARLSALAAEPFDLARQIPLRAALVTGTAETVLLVTVHHIAIDEWSTATVIGDLAAAYARRTGAGGSAAGVRDDAGADTRSGERTEYVDYALFQHRLLGTAADPTPLAARQLDYWRTALAGLPAESGPPTDRPRPARQSYRGAVEYLGLDADLVADLHVLADAHRVSMFMLAQTAVAILLHRAGAGTDIALGTPVSGRTEPGLESLVGFFLNTVVLRTDLSGDPTVAQQIARGRETVLAAFDHQDVPFERVVAATAGDGAGRAAARAAHPLFQVMVVYLVDRLPGGADGETGLGRPRAVGTGTAKFDLSFDFVEDAVAGVVGGRIEYSTDLFDQVTIAQMARTLEQVFRSMVRAPQAPISELDLLDARSRDRMLTDWSPGPDPWPDATPAADAPGTVAALFDAAVAAYPQRTAVLHGDRAWTFARLGDRVYRLARLLIAHGVGPEDTVVIDLPRSAEALAAMYAVIVAGGAYAATDPQWPRARTTELISATRAAVVFTGDPGSRERAEDGDGAPVRLDPAAPELIDRLAQLPGGPVRQSERRTALRDGHPVYRVQTSGSTGRPKTVVVTHRGLTALYRAHRAGLHHPADERAGGGPLTVGHAWSTAFDASWQPQLWMLGGHTVDLVDEDTRRDPAALVARSRRARWDFVELTPAHLQLVLEHGLCDRAAGHIPTTVGFGGEAASATLWRRLRAAAEHVAAVNLYGPSEATVDALSAWVTDAPVPVIGRPVGEDRAYILDAALRPVPPGVVGELYLAGAGVARGYHGESARTAHRFPADPHGPAGTRMYRTGDRARWTVDGQVRFLGRSDDQVKVRGYRVEPGEIAAALSGLNTIGQAAVIAATGPDGATVLHGYVTAGTCGTEPDPARVRRELATLLPAYMVPATISVLSALPVNANGKLDRSRLPAPTAPPRPAHVPARTEDERAVCAVVAALLADGGDDLVPVGLADPLEAAAMDSMAVMTVVAGLRAAGRQVPVHEVFDAQTVADLVTAFRAAPPVDADPGGAGAVDAETDGRFDRGR